VASVELGDGRIATYEIVGDGEPLLMFVGGPGFAASFMRPDAELFADRFRSYLIDPPGSGGSTPPADKNDYGFEGHARFYEDVRAALNLGEVSLLGHSFGGGVAVAYAAMFPNVVTRCICVNAFAFGVELDEEEGGDQVGDMEAALLRHKDQPWYDEARAIWDDWTELVVTDSTSPATVNEMFGKVMPFYLAHPERPAVARRIEEGRPLIEIDLEAGKVWEDGLYQRADLRPLATRVTAPTLIITGDADLVAGPAQARGLADNVPGAKLVIFEDSGHIPSWEEPEKYRAAVLEWLEA
jgi:proline iminopeptidase